MATLGIVGLGLLGSAVAGRLRAGGHDVVGYDLVAEKGKALVELGGRAAPSAEAVAKSVEAVSQGEGIIFVGGERSVFARWRPVLETILPRAVFIGAAGQAMVLKLVANLLVALHSAAAAEALLLARQAGLDLGLVLDVLSKSAATSRMLEVRGPLIARDEFPPQMKLDLFMKDLHLIQEAARSVSAPLPLTDVAERLYAAAMEAGHGGADLSVVVKAIEGIRRI